MRKAARLMFNFAGIFGGMTDSGRDRDRRLPHMFTITDSPRLTRALWDRFRASAEARGDKTIDALRQALELYIAQEPKV